MYLCCRYGVHDIVAEAHFVDMIATKEGKDAQGQKVLFVMNDHELFDKVIADGPPDTVEGTESTTASGAGAAPVPYSADWTGLQ